METITYGRRWESEFTYRVYPVRYIDQMWNLKNCWGRETNRIEFDKLAKNKNWDFRGMSELDDYQKWVFVFEQDYRNLEKVYNSQSETLGYFCSMGRGKGDTYELGINSEFMQDVRNFALEMCAKELSDPRIVTFSVISKKETSRALKLLERHNHALLNSS
jgi:hypothetical protein